MSSLSIVRPSFEEAMEIKKGGEYKYFPLSMEILSDSITPITALRKIKSATSHCFMLESVVSGEHCGRYSFLGFDPKLQISCDDNVMEVGEKSFVTDNPGNVIRDIVAEYKCPVFDYLPTFAGGLVGYFSYDYMKYPEKKLKLDAKNREGFKDVDLMLFDKVIAFDNLKNVLVIMVLAKLDTIETDYESARKELFAIKDLLLNGKIEDEPSGKILDEPKPFMNEKKYCEAVEKVKKFIKEGDIFQLVLSNTISCKYEGSLLNMYRVLRTKNPSPYMFYMRSSELEVAGASPETLVKLEKGVLHTFPLAGTRPRGKTKEEDLRLEEELLCDEKELAEHNMLVDLGRNDIGRISRFGTVKVEKLRSIERFSHVMHIGSSVRGEIRDDCDAVDAINAVLPAGTLSGAPKLRACEIINELEDNKRGIYGGAIGYIDFSGNADTAIAIRIAYKRNGKVYVRSGAGIVYDSIPQKEYKETINKAAAVIEALKEAQDDSFN